MNWPVFNIGNKCSVKRGTTITQNQATSGAIPVVAGGLMPTYFHDTPNRSGNVITVSASGGNAGFINFWETPILASDCSTVEPENPDVIIKYVFHFLRGKQEYIYSKLRSGAAQPHVYAKDIAALEIPLPPPPNNAVSPLFWIKSMRSEPSAGKPWRNWIASRSPFSLRCLVM